MNVIYIIIPTVLLVLMTLYLFYFIKGIIKEVRHVDNKWNSINALVVLILISILGWNLLKFTAVVAALHIVILGLLTKLLVFLIAKISSKDNPKLYRIYRLGVIPIAITVITLVIGSMNMTAITRTNYDIETAKLQSGESLKIAMIADTHLDNALTAQDLSKYAKAIESEHPDALLLVGDIFDESTSKGDMVEACKILGSVKTKEGVFFVYGNHDKATYGGNKEFSSEEMEKCFKAAGVKVLKDQVIKFNKFTLVGRMDYSGDLNKDPRKPLMELLHNVNKNNFIINMDHQPKDTVDAAAKGVDLQLSGHTHNGQIWPAGLLNYIFHFNEYEYGIHSIGNYKIIVTSGMSGWGLPVRTEGHSEYVIVNISGK